MSIGGELPNPEGSTWRRWDPHVHLPGTLFNNEFGALTIPEALNILATRSPAVEAICVTDYYTTTIYRHAVKEWKAGAGASIKALIPNVELRLDIPTKAGKGVNFHMLCGPEEVDELDRFIGLFEFTSMGKKYRADDDDLIALGRAFTKDQGLDEYAAKREGANQFKVGFEELREKYLGDDWAKHHCLVGFAGGERDGTSGVRTEDGAFVARRQEMETLAHMMFTANPQQIEFWSGLRESDPVETLVEKYGGLKLCIHGSDCHDETSLGVSETGRLMWLKGDPSFDTLKMACLSPVSRAHIGEEPPTAGYDHGRIAKVRVTSPSTWFGAGSLPINPGLVAIIGARGSGKTALADLVAAGAGSDRPFLNDQSFVVRANKGKLLTTSRVSVEWSHGETTECDFSEGVEQFEDTYQRPVRYLSQQFVDRLCAADGVSNALLTEIQRVIFEAWPTDQRQGATSFHELLDIRIGAARSRKEAELQAVAALSDAITEQRVLKEGLFKRTKERTDLEQKIKELDNETKNLTSKASDKKSAARLGEINAALQRRQTSYQALDRRVTDLTALQSEAATARTTKFPDYTNSLKRAHVASVLNESEWKDFDVDFTGDVTTRLSTAIGATTKERDKIAGVADGSIVPAFDDVPAAKLTSRTIVELRAEQLRLQRLVGLDADRQKQLETLIQQTTQQTARLNKLNEDIVLAEAADEKGNAFVEQRLVRYESYFDALLEEEQQLHELYAPLSDLISGFGKSVSKLKFLVRRVVDIDGWAAQGEDFIDLRSGLLEGGDTLAGTAAKELLPAWESGDGATAASAIRKFSQDHSGRFRKLQKASFDAGDDGRGWDRALSKWLYSAAHVSLTYSLEYENLRIEKLSPGTRGIVLLLLYLAIDQQETDPLIID